MKNSYAVYFDNQKIHFIRDLTGNGASRYSMVCRSPGWGHFMEFIDSGAPSMACLSDDPGRQFRAFASMFHPAEAAGGLVSDPTNHWLFIFRRGRWDLPKGMMERGETPAQAALREVQEECGIGELEVIHTLEPTYHVYPLENSDDWALKKTNWFFMRTRICCQAEPQLSEGITRAEWKHPGRLEDVMQSTYGNIKEMLLSCKARFNE